MVTEMSKLPGTSSPARWKDSKRHMWLLGPLGPSLTLLSWGLVSWTGLGIFWWFGPMFVFGLVPLADAIIGTDPSNPPESAVPDLERDRYYRWCTYFWLPMQYAALIWGCWIITSHHLGTFATLGVALGIGAVGGVAINAAHELGHKKDVLERRLSKVALAQTFYGHFYVEHNVGHHVRVATPEDPASSRLGESLWAFLPRTIVGGLRSAWHLESARLARAGHRTWSPRNHILNAWALSIALYGGLLAGFGPSPELIIFLVVQAVFGFSLLESVNYLEHYGLLRQKDASGRYERTQPRHSWNSNQIASNVLLYHLQRHSDHHANPTRRYQALRHFDEAPQLPSGYSAMIMLAYVPPLWRRVMDPHVLAHYGGDVTLANIQPGRRDALVRRYPVTSGT